MRAVLGRVLIGMMVVTVAGAFIGYAAVQNPHRPALQARIRALDTQLVVLRAYSKLPEELEAEGRELRASLDAMYLPSPAALRADLAAIGATVEWTEGTEETGCRLDTLRFRAPDRRVLAALVEELTPSPPMLRVSVFEVDAAGVGQLTALGCTRVTPAAAEDPLPPLPESSGLYGILNADLERAIEQKQAELAALDRQFPLARGAASRRAEFHADRAAFRALETQRGIRGLGAALLLGDPPLLAHGRVEAKPELVVVRGQPTVATAGREAYTRAVGPSETPKRSGYSIIRFRVGEGGGTELEMTLQPEQASPPTSGKQSAGSSSVGATP